MMEFFLSLLVLFATRQPVPQWITVEGRATIYYELYIPDSSATVEVLNAKDSTVLKTLTANGQGLVYIELSLPRPVKHIVHRVGKTITGAMGPLTSSNLVIGSPVSDGAWVAVYDPAWERGHRRVTYDGRIPGRYAIDFIRVDEQGRFAHDDEDAIKNWYGYGAQVLAVADGVVASVRHDFTESALVSKHVQPDAAMATGNYIALDIGHGRFAFYEHLQPGSIQVQPGQRVKKGDAIGALGFTGQSTGPHLHFHIADNNSPLEAEGMPFAFEGFTVLGKYQNLDKFGTERWQGTKPFKVKNERPGSNTVINFK